MDTQPGDRTDVAVGTFGGVSALPLRVAQAEGLFAAQGLTVEASITRDSARLRDRLESGELGVVHAAPDNVIAWTDAGPTSFRAWLAGSNGPITLVGRGAAATADLRGRRIGVDSPSGGFAPILRRLLAGASLEPEDVEIVSLGATRSRYTALGAGDIDATMLTLPWSLMAVADGATVLGSHADVASELLTSCAVSTVAWLTDEAGTARAYARAIDGALGWLRDEAHRDAAATLLADDMGLEMSTARAIMETMAEPSSGWPSRGRLLGGELAPTWQLRAEAMAPPAELSETYVHALAGEDD